MAKKMKNRPLSDKASGIVTTINSSDIGDTGDSRENLSETGKIPTKIKLPPLVVKGVHLNILIRELASLGVKAEYKLGRFGIKVMLHTRADFDVVLAHLKDTKVEFYTHDIPSEKPFRAVIRGLPNFDPKTIMGELTDRYKLAPTAIFRMTRRDEKVKIYPDSLFLVHFQKGTVTLSALKAIRSIHSIIIRWEPYRGGQRDVTQCQRCLFFGHGTRNCYLKPRCGFCAKDHITTECPAEEAVVLKCANCGGTHHGSDKKCPNRENFKLIRKQASIANQPGRKKEKPPAFRAEDFPPLHGQLNPRLRSIPPQKTTVTSEVQGPPSPSGAWKSAGEQASNPDLYSRNELLEIFSTMIGTLAKCRSKLEQIQALGKFIIQYGV